MAFDGNLETMPVADVLRWAANGRLTGTIRITRGEIAKMIYIQKGRIVSCTSTDPKEFLGHFMVSKGVITETDLQEAFISQDRFAGFLARSWSSRARSTSRFSTRCRGSRPKRPSSRSRRWLRSTPS